jgi:nucleotide-binding universal stress UspA family protein
MEFKNILVAVGGRVSDDEAIRLACKLAKKGKTKIWAVYVITIERSLPLEAEIETEVQRAEGILDHAEQVAGKEDFELQTDVLQARDAGPAIIDEAIEKGVDLIVVGIRQIRHFGQFSLGDVVPYILKNAPCRVIIDQQAT